jgi:hypothetical protein
MSVEINFYHIRLIDFKLESAIAEEQEKTNNEKGTKL